MKDYCVLCGEPYPSAFVYTDANGKDRWAHYACRDEFVKRLLSVPPQQQGEDYAVESV